MHNHSKASTGQLSAKDVSLVVRYPGRAEPLIDVDGVNETWMVTGVVGYRFDIRGHPANVMAGYRTLFIDYEEDGAELDINAHGPIFGLAIDF